MARKKRRSYLGLHTEEERDQALLMVSRTYEKAVDAFFAGDEKAYTFHLGYITGIQELAAAEGATVLAGMITDAITRLRQL